MPKKQDLVGAKIKSRRKDWGEGLRSCPMPSDPILLENSRDSKQRRNGIRAVSECLEP